MSLEIFIDEETGQLTVEFNHFFSFEPAIQSNIWL